MPSMAMFMSSVPTTSGTPSEEMRTQTATGSKQIATEPKPEMSKSSTLAVPMDAFVNVLESELLRSVTISAKAGKLLGVSEALVGVESTDRKELFRNITDHSMDASTLVAEYREKSHSKLCSRSRSRLRRELKERSGYTPSSSYLSKPSPLTTVRTHLSPIRASADSGTDWSTISIDISLLLPMRTDTILEETSGDDSSDDSMPAPKQFKAGSKYAITPLPSGGKYALTGETRSEDFATVKRALPLLSAPSSSPMPKTTKLKKKRRLFGKGALVLQMEDGSEMIVVAKATDELKTRGSLKADGKQVALASVGTMPPNNTSSLKATDEETEVLSTISVAADTLMSALAAGTPQTTVYFE